jgi:hypothetical protein
MRDEFERNVSHTAYAPVARAMGYTVQGLIELCERCSVNPVEWTTIGMTRNGANVDGERGQWRVAALWNPETERYVFSVGPKAYKLTENAREAERIRAEIAQAIVNAVNNGRDSETRKVIAGARRMVQREQAEKHQVTEAQSGPEAMIIYPIAPRDPRGI